MNNRLNEFAEHCDFYIGNEHYDKSHEEQQRLFMEKFAELIVTHCASLCMAKADRKNILNAYNLLTEGDVKYPAPEQQGHRSQYEREYNLP
jgi:hypothetical protein